MKRRRTWWRRAESWWVRYEPLLWLLAIFLAIDIVIGAGLVTMNHYPAPIP